ncbi:MAG: hypothetical protein ACPG42_01995 [Alphaproteobacteria bacterium]
MIDYRIGLLSTVLAFGLTGCAGGFVPSISFNLGRTDKDFHQIVLDASARGQQTYDRDGRLIAVEGPLNRGDDSDLPLEIQAIDEPIELAASLATLPIPAIRPQIELARYDEIKPIEPNTSALIDSNRTTSEVASTAVVQPAPSPDLQDLLAAEPERAVVRDAAPVPAAYQDSDPAAGLPLLSTNRDEDQSARSTPSTGTSTRSTAIPAGTGDLSSDILSMSDEEIDILLVQLESDSSGLERVRKMTPEEKAKLRKQYERRSFLGHFAKMDRGNDGALTREEMMAYFTIMHAAFDADYDDVVTRAEAPTLLLRIKLLGRGFPAEGLTLEELRARLEETFVFLDKNNNDKLGWPELL